jgi:hypothetical protein
MGLSAHAGSDNRFAVATSAQDIQLHVDPQSATIIINIMLAPIVIFAQLTISLLLLRREFRRRLVSLPPTLQRRRQPRRRWLVGPP